MGISPKKFLDRYFTSEQLKEPLDDIGLSVGGTKKERIERIVENWTTHHRNWYDLLEFLDWGKLSKVCDEFGISYSEYNTEETLRDKIEDEQVIDSQRKIFQTKISHTQNPSNTKKQVVKKFNPYVIVTISIWLIIGISFSMLNLTGFFIPTHEESIKISKDYRVYFETWTNSTYSGQSSGLNLNGEVTFQSTLFSAKNPIDVTIELTPNVFVDENPLVFESVPQPVSVFFVGTSTPNSDPEDIDDVTRIFLKQSTDPEKLTGSGTIIYSQGGTHEIYLIDPRETGLVHDLLSVNEPPNVIILSQVPEPPIYKNLFDENGNPFPIPTRMDLASETEPYFFEIRQSDALNSLESEKINTFAIWLAIAIGPVGIVITLLMRQH